MSLHLPLLTSCTYTSSKFLKLLLVRGGLYMKVGPINAFNGFPVWYKDENGLRLQLNFDHY